MRSHAEVASSIVIGLWCAAALQGLVLSWPWVEAAADTHDNPLWAAGLAVLAVITTCAMAISGSYRELFRDRARLLDALDEAEHSAANLEGLARGAVGTLHRERAEREARR